MRSNAWRRRALDLAAAHAAQARSKRRSRRARRVHVSVSRRSRRRHRPGDRVPLSRARRAPRAATRSGPAPDDDDLRAGLRRLAWSVTSCDGDAPSRPSSRDEAHRVPQRVVGERLLLVPGEPALARQDQIWSRCTRRSSRIDSCARRRCPRSCAERRPRITSRCPCRRDARGPLEDVVTISLSRARAAGSRDRPARGRL